MNTPFHLLFNPPSNFVPYHGVGRFPVQADDAVPARVDPTGINQADKQDRLVASVAWSTVLDAIMRAERMAGTSGSGRGLRGGSYTVTKSQTMTTIDYQAVRFSNDVTVTGHATRELATNTIDAQVTVEQTEDQSGNQQGTLSFHGVLYTRTENFASPNGAVLGIRHVYAAPARLRLNHWALAGDWTVERHAIVLNAAEGRIADHFQARDLHLVMGPAARGTSVRFRVRIDGQPPGAAHGTDVDDQGHGMVSEPRLYQLLRQPGPVTERTFEITFLDPGLHAYAFTFG